MMKRDGLLDTGVLVAFLDAAEKRHEDCVQVLRDFRGRLLTTEAVLTEAMYLLHRFTGTQGTAACVEFVLRKGCILVPTSLPALARCRELMEKYEDVPMDYADATLVTLAEELGVALVLTLDRRGFLAFRRHGKGAFEVLP